MNGYYSKEEIKKIGFRKVGEDVKISKLVRIFRPERISIGNNVRIDDYCVLSGDITIGNNVFLAFGVKIMCGKARLSVGDYVGIAYQTVIIGEADDYSGNYLYGPLVPEKYRKVTGNKITINSYCIIGANCTILPDITISEGCSFGAMSLINKDTEPWTMYIGIPCRKYKKRNKNMLNLLKELENIKE